MAIQGMSNVFNIAVNVLNSETPGMICVVPRNALVNPNKIYMHHTKYAFIIATTAFSNCLAVV